MHFQVRERDTSGAVIAAVITANLLITDFPENEELRRFVAMHRQADGRRPTPSGQQPSGSAP